MSGRVYDLHAAAVVQTGGWREMAAAPWSVDPIGRVICADCVQGRADMDPVSAVDAQGEVETADALGDEVACDACGARFVDARPRGGDIDKEPSAHIRARAVERWAAGWRGPWATL